MATSAKVVAIRQMAEQQRGEVVALDDDVVDAEVVEQSVLDEGQAQRLDQSIRLLASTVRDQFVRLQEKVHEAKAGDVWRTLGFASWPAYLVDVFGGQPLVLDRADRPELVDFLASEGMSVRAIASVTGTSKSTVDRDLQASLADRQVSRRGTPDLRRETTGLDNKSYTRPVDEQKSTPKPRRRPLPDALSSAIWDLGKRVTTITNLSTDDRMQKNKDAIVSEFNALTRERNRLDEALCRMASVVLGQMYDDIVGDGEIIGDNDAMRDLADRVNREAAS